MAKYTVQLHSTSGSFASPWGKDVKHFDTLAEIRDGLEEWANEHPKVGADRADAHCLVWHGKHRDVTDLYPDFELTYGPRGGIRRQPC